MKVCVPVGPSGELGPRWGKAERVAVAEVDGGEIRSWTEYQVDWDRLHDEGTEGSHHARVVRFLREQGIEAIGIRHLGQGMYLTLGKLGIAVIDGLDGAARAAAVYAAGAASAR